MRCIQPDYSTRTWGTIQEGAPKTQIIFIAAPFVSSEAACNLKHVEELVEKTSTAEPGSIRSDVQNYASLYSAYIDNPGFFPRCTLTQYANRNNTRDAGAIPKGVFGPPIKDVHDRNDDTTTLMVDQLWMWILNETSVVACFPERWEDDTWDFGKHGPLARVLNPGRHRNTPKASDLALLLMSYHFGLQHSHSYPEPEWRLAGRFEQILGSISATEGLLLENFSAIYKNLDPETYLAQPEFVKALNNLTAEKDLLNELRIVQDELHVLKMILGEQKRVAQAFMRLHLDGNVESSDPSLAESAQSMPSDTETHVESPDIVIDQGLHGLIKPDDQASRIANSLSELLQLKQAHSNAFELRFSRELALETAKQGRAVLVFTTVTIIFSPLSFVAAFFTMSLTNQPDKMTLSYVSKYVFGFGFAVAIPCIFLALSVSEWRSWWLRAWNAPVRPQGDATSRPVDGSELPDGATKKDTVSAPGGNQVTGPVSEHQDLQVKNTEPSAFSWFTRKYDDKTPEVKTAARRRWRAKKSPKGPKDDILPR